MADIESVVEGVRVSFIPCAAWVPKGVAKSNPDKVEISKEDLDRIIQETKGNVRELEEVEEEAYKEIEEEEKDGGTKHTKQEKENKVKKVPGKVKEEDDGKDFSSRYNLVDYDDEKEDDKLDQLLQLGRLTVHSSNEEDPYVTIKDDNDADSENENNQILPSDNLIAVGHVESDAAILEVYVYNGEEGSLYIHHDVLLPAVPLCMEWLNYDAEDEELKPANMVAIGSMSPAIQVWDLDVINCLQPAYTLGKKGKKKKKVAGVGHRDPVLCLSWNKHAEHVLASGSVDQTVILWDLEHSTVAQQLHSFEEKVQTINWHHKEAHTLLTGACDGKVRIFDCRTSDDYKTWKLDGEVECAIWQTTTSEPYSCLASTEAGTVFAIDARQEKPLWTLKAHNKSCTAIRMSPECPGCLVSVSADKSIKVWDIMDGKPSFIEENLPQLGTIQCLASSPDAPFVFCMGGDNKENNFKVWDIRQSSYVRSRFCNRVGLPADEEEEVENNGRNEMDVDGAFGAAGFNFTAATHSGAAQAGAAAARPKKPKFRKKKGGHLDNRRRNW